MSELARREGVEVDRPDLLDPETDSWIATVADVARLAAYLCDTDFVPRAMRGNAPATAATILYGREVGVAPLTALQTMHVINGRVGMAAELMRARVLAAGHELDVVESTAAVCRMRGRRRGSERWVEVSWSMGDARAAGLNGDGWRKYPRAMLVARASAELCRLAFPDVTHGMAATEEFDGDTAPSSTTVEPATPARKVSRAKRTPPEPPPSGEAESADSAADGPGAAPHTSREGSPTMGPPRPPGRAVAPRGEVSTPRADPPPEVPEPPPSGVVPGAPPAAAPELPDEHMPGEDPLPFDGTEHLPREPDEVIEADPLVGDEADPREQARLKGDGPATRAQTRHVMALLRRLGVGQTREERLHIGQALVARRVESFSELTVTDAGRMITTLLIAADSDNPSQFLRYLVDEEHRKLDEAEPSSGVGDE